MPPVTTSASASGTITVSPDKSVSGSITVSGMQPTAAHIHEGAKGENGPVVIPLTNSSDNTCAVLAGAKLTDAQYEKAISPRSFTLTCTAQHTRAVNMSTAKSKIT